MMTYGLLGKMIQPWVSAPVIFYLHRMGERDGTRLSPNEDMKVSADFLRGFIRDARTSGWSFVSMDEIWADLTRGTSGARKIALTFDDGYRDNLTCAYPVLRELEVPFCVYVTTGLINNEATPWWMELEGILLTCADVRGPDSELIECFTLELKIQAFFLLRDQFMSPMPAVRDRAHAWLESFHGKGEVKHTARQFLTWDEIRSWGGDTLVTIGAHTMTHPVLASLDKACMLKEIEVSRQVIAQETGRNVEHFAYPFGTARDAGEREFSAVHEMGFKTAVTTSPGFIRGNHRHRLTALPRIMLSENLSFNSIGTLYFNSVMRETRKSFRRAVLHSRRITG